MFTYARRPCSLSSGNTLAIRRFARPQPLNFSDSLLSPSSSAVLLLHCACPSLSPRLQRAQFRGRNHSHPPARGHINPGRSREASDAVDAPKSPTCRDAATLQLEGRQLVDDEGAGCAHLGAAGDNIEDAVPGGGGGDLPNAKHPCCEEGEAETVAPCPEPSASRPDVADKAQRSGLRCPVSPPLTLPLPHPEDEPSGALAPASQGRARTRRAGLPSAAAFDKDGKFGDRSGEGLGDVTNSQREGMGRSCVGGLADPAGRGIPPGTAQEASACADKVRM